MGNKNWAEFQQICSLCGGGGELGYPHHTQSPDPDVSVQCPQCKGEGYIGGGRLKIKDILDAIEEINQ